MWTLVLNKAELADRNRAKAQALHRTSIRQRIRRASLHLLAHIPAKAKTAHNQQRILLIRPDHLGDVLLTTPAICALRAALPDAEIHILVGEWSQAVLTAYSEIDRILTLPFPGFTRQPSNGVFAPYQLAYRYAQQLRNTGYNCAIIFRPDHWWGAMLAHLAGIPERWGYNHPDTRVFLTHHIEWHHEHAIVQNMRLVEQWVDKQRHQQINYRFPVAESDRLMIDALLFEKRINRENPIICIHPGSGTQTKQWRESQWARVADVLHKEWDATIILTGTKSEYVLTQQIAAQMKYKAHNLAGQTTIGQLAALYRQSHIVLGPDSGPLHLAAAVATSTVALFGPADPVEFAPWGAADEHVVLTSDIACRPCRILEWAYEHTALHPCVHDITVTQVLDAARKILGKNNSFME
ncbi:MAG: lipopolysaccharide heptosyltransferase II [Chloroflexi bacterium]|nr:MAG: lipopolysaccharide heptosyltransferase II [Chloroflexota bacterium]